MKYKKVISSPLGKIEVIEEEKKIIELKINQTNKDEEEIQQKDTELLVEAEKQLKEYFLGERKKFNLPIKQEGTEFRKKVWNELEKIPYGETRTYKQIAEAIGNPKAVRAVGMANHINQIPIIIPCHRVIGSNGKLVGYALGLEMKKYLLNLEKENKNKK